MAGFFMKRFKAVFLIASLLFGFPVLAQEVASDSTWRSLKEYFTDVEDSIKKSGRILRKLRQELILKQ